MKTKPLLRLLFIFLFALTSCSQDDEPACMETNITMEINGELQSFQASGRGIDIRPNGYELQINLSRRIVEPLKQQGFYITLPYKKTGENIVERFHYLQYTSDDRFEGDFLQGELQSNILTNTRKCFYATFSGKLNDGDQEIIITNGVLSYTYETPFDE